MDEEIKKISCLSCGGQLAIDPDQAVAECPYCGNVYLSNGECSGMGWGVERIDELVETDFADPQSDM